MKVCPNIYLKYFLNTHLDNVFIFTIIITQITHIRTHKKGMTDFVG